MHYEIEITESQPTRTAVVRSRVRAEELSRFVPAACGEVWSFIRSTGLPRPGRHLALYLDAEGALEVGAEVSEWFVGTSRIHCSQLPAGRVAHAVHFGAYARLSETHKAVQEWCAARGHRRTNVSWELYGHWQESWNEDPAKIRTDVFHLLEEETGLA